MMAQAMRHIHRRRLESPSRARPFRAGKTTNFNMFLVKCFRHVPTPRWGPNTGILLQKVLQLQDRKIQTNGFFLTPKRQTGKQMAKVNNRASNNITVNGPESAHHHEDTADDPLTVVVRLQNATPGHRRVLAIQKKLWS